MALQAFYITFRYPALAPVTTSPILITAEWDDLESRLFRYLHYDHYYHNTVFSALELYRNQHLKQRGLYKYTRSIYNPVFRLVEIHTSKSYGGPLDWEDMSEGAVPLAGANNQVKEAVRELWKWSNFGTKKTVYARNGARFGDAVIKLVDDPLEERVHFEFLHPGLIKEVVRDPAGFVKSVVIEYERKDDDQDTKTWLYTEVIDEDHFATFRDGEPFALYTDAEGVPVPEWENPYGFVPLVVTPAMDLGRVYGATPFHAGLDKFDQANDLASILFDQIRKTVNSVWYLAGVASVKQLQESQLQATATDQQKVADQERSSVPAIVGPPDSKPIPMVAPLDIPGGLAALDSILSEIERDYPELAFHRMREFAQHSFPAVVTVLGDGIDRLLEVRTNLDDGLLMAMQMGIAMGAFHRYEAFRAFSPTSFIDGSLDFRIGERPILRDTLSKKETLEILDQTDAPKPWIWEQLGRSKQEIAAAESQQLNTTRQVAGELARVLATGRQNGQQQPQQQPSQAQQNQENDRG